VALAPIASVFLHQHLLLFLGQLGKQERNLAAIVMGYLAYEGLRLARKSSSGV
jgi:hypothetical protein